MKNYLYLSKKDKQFDILCKSSYNYTMFYIIPFAAMGIITLINKRGENVVPNNIQEKLLTDAARLVAGTIDPYKMGLTPEQVDVENFIIHFKEKAAEILVCQDVLKIAIGPYVNTFNPGIYSNDIRIILDSIEEKMQIKFDFYYGILIYLSKNELSANWLPH